jgi:hypothetical protein
LKEKNRIRSSVPDYYELGDVLNAWSLLGEDPQYALITTHSFWILRGHLSNSIDFSVKNDKFMVSALGYVEESLLNAEIVKLLPNYLVPVICGLLRRYLDSHIRHSSFIEIILVDALLCSRINLLEASGVEACECPQTNHYLLNID